MKLMKMTAEQDRKKPIGLLEDQIRLFNAILIELRKQRKILNGIRVVSKKTLDTQKIAQKGRKYT